MTHGLLNQSVVENRGNDVVLLNYITVAIQLL